MGLVFGMLKRVSVVLALLVVAVWCAGKVLAITDPDTLSVISVRAYSGVLESGDLLVIVKYDVAYGSLPSETITETFVGRFLAGGSEVNSVEPVAFNDRGWGVGIFSFYFDAAAVVTDSIEFENTNSETYEVAIQGKPTAFVDPPKVVSAGLTWRDATDTIALLQQDIADLAQELENDADWVANNVDLIGSASSGQTALTTDGEDYFARAIPNLSAMVPDLFSTSLTTPTFFERDHGDSFDAELRSFWDGTPVDDGFQAFADMFQMPKSVAKALIGFGILALVVMVVQVKSRSVEMGVMSAAFMLAILTAGSFFTLTMAALITFLAVLLLGWTIWLRRAS